MKKILLWIGRGGIAAALVMMIVTIWPSAVAEYSQSFELSSPGQVQSTITFRSPEKIHRGAQMDFSVLLDLDHVPLVDENVHPVMVYRLELDGAEIVPDAIFQIPLTGVKHQETGWRVRLPQGGTHHGTWWVYMEYVGQDGQIIDRQAIFARRFTIASQEIFGMSVNGARWLSMIGLVLSLGGEVWSRFRRK